MTASRQSDRDTQILEALTQKVRMLTADQAGATWWPDTKRPSTAARAKLDSLCEAKLLARHEITTHRFLPLESLLFSWRPGQASPSEDEFGALAYRLQSRWPESPPRREHIYTATPKLANRLGGFNGRVFQREQVTHDLHVTELYLRLLRNEPERARRWRGEELQKRSQAYGEKLPDAVLVDQNGRPVLAIEFGGKYPKNRVRDFHLHCAMRELGYDLW